jgi:ferredoxin
MTGNSGVPRPDPEPALLRELIAAQICAWCGRGALRSLANHTVMAHGIRAAELRRLAGLPTNAPLCSPTLSERHRALAREQGAVDWLHRPEVFLAAAATPEAQYDDDQRERRVQHLNAVRDAAVQAMQRTKDKERAEPELAAARLIVWSKARRLARDGVECGICGAWFCSVVLPGKDYRQRQYCSAECRREAQRRVRRRAWRRQALKTMHSSD